MKRFSKMLALGLAAVLVFGMTAQAAGSTDADNSEVEAGTLEENASVSDTVEIDGEKVTAKFEKAPLSGSQLAQAKSDVASESVIKNIQEAIKKITGSTTVEFVGEPKVAAAFDLVAPSNLTAEQLEKGVTVGFKVDAKADTLYSVIHYLADGTYEILGASVSGNMIYVTFHSFSPVVIVEQEVKAGTTTPDNNNNNNNNNNNDDDDAAQNPATSPKTGEAAPVAAVMAVVLMAGAVICAKKVRYNR